MHFKPDGKIIRFTNVKLIKILTVNDVAIAAHKKAPNTS
jgi:hypothetical protein